MGTFGQANVALTHWVKESFIFILIRVASALAKWTEITRMQRFVQANKQKAKVCWNDRGSDSVDYSGYRTQTASSHHVFRRLVRSSRKLQQICLGSMEH